MEYLEVIIGGKVYVIGPWLIFHILLVLRLNGHTNIKYWGIVIPIVVQLLLGLVILVVASRKFLR